MSVVVSETGKSGSTFSIISLASSQRQQSFLVRISICILILKQPTQPLLAAGGVRPLSIPKVICYKLVNYSLLKKPEMYTPIPTKGSDPQVLHRVGHGRDRAPNN